MNGIAIRHNRNVPSDLLIGSEQSEFVRGTFLGRAFPDREDSADGNWIKLRVQVRTLPCTGSYDALWRAESLAPFRKALEDLYDSLEGDVVVEPDWKRSIELRFHGDGLGMLRSRERRAPMQQPGHGCDLSFPRWIRPIFQT